MYNLFLCARVCVSVCVFVSVCESAYVRARESTILARVEGKNYEF